MFQVISVIFCLIFSNTAIAGSLDSFEESAIQPPSSNTNSDTSDSSNNSYSSNNSDNCEDNNIHLDCIGYYILKNIFEGMLYGGLISTARVNIYVNKKFNEDEKIVKTSSPHNDESHFIPDDTINSRHTTDDSAIAINSKAENNLKKEETSNNFTQSSNHNSLPLRKPSEPLIPFIRADVALQYIKSSIWAKDYRLVLGYGPLAFQINQTQFTESSPSDTLKLTRVFGVYRMSYGTEFEINIGLGKLIIDGNKKTEQYYFTIPLKLHPSKSIGFEYRPAWSTTINDYDLSVFSHFKYGSIKAGYRWLSTNSQSLNGPYVGFAAFY